jgi:lysophospholipase L1-like esterase
MLRAGARRGKGARIASVGFARARRVHRLRATRSFRLTWTWNAMTIPSRSNAATRSLVVGLLALAAVRAPLAAQPPTAEQVAERHRLEDERLRTDWAGLQRYRQANAELGAPARGARRVVFMGNSITDAWARWFPTMFPGKPYVGRGISGQTTPQMLVRFRQDVVALRPAVVVLLAGTNDIAGNTGPSSLEMIEDNIASMTEIARANGIRVVLASVLPAFDYPWKPGVEPAPKIVALNAWLRDYAAKHGAVYLDYHSAMADARQGLRAELTSDGVHPNEAGYRVMAPLAERAIAEALRRR